MYNGENGGDCKATAANISNDQENQPHISPSSI